MITTEQPSDWRALQSMVGRILEECGLSVEVEKKVTTARGTVEVDVYAEEQVKGRPYKILCECKHWKKAVPQTIVHAFRTVVSDSGANLGYIVGSSGFQIGAEKSIELTNVRLLNWEAFQEEFEETWVDTHFVPLITERFDRFMELVEPLPPPEFHKLSDNGKRKFAKLVKQYMMFGAFLMQFTTHGRMLGVERTEKPPFRNAIPESLREEFPDAILDAPAYREFLDEAKTVADEAVRSIEEVVRSDGV